MHAACDEEIDAFLSWRSFLEDAGRDSLPADLQRQVDAMIGFPASPEWFSQWMNTAGVADIARVIVAATRSKELYREEQDFAYRSKLHQFRISQAFPRLAERFPALIDLWRLWKGSGASGLGGTERMVRAALGAVGD